MFLASKYFSEDFNLLRAIRIIVGLPVWELIFTVFAILITLSLLFFIALRLISGPKREIDLSDGFLMGANLIFATYGLLLAFLIFGMYGATQQTEDAISEETTTLYCILQQSQAFNNKEEINHAVQTYAYRVVNEEWPSLTSGNFKDLSDISYSIDQQFVTSTQSLKPKGIVQEAVYTWLPSAIKELTEAHERRILKGDSHLPLPIWRILVLSTMFILWFLAYSNPWKGPKSFIPVFGVSLVLSLSLSVLISLHYPFRGPISVSNTPYLELLKKH